MGGKYSGAQEKSVEQGSYVMILKNTADRTIQVGKLGMVHFRKGYYVYVGSGMGSLHKRVARHYRACKKMHWHIDYLTPMYMKIEKTYLYFTLYVLHTAQRSFQI
ncbi:MAG: GIY-YIG nuclease family protein [Spirochaetota bacterium]